MTGRGEQGAPALGAALSTPAGFDGNGFSLPMGASTDRLESRLREVLAGRAIRIIEHRRLKAAVHRLCVEVDGTERGLIVKWSDASVARRNWLVARAWLPAAGLEGLGPPLIALAAEPALDGAWQIYDELPGEALSPERSTDGEVEAAVEAVARVHTAFAEHRLLRECRLWGGDRGIRFYSSSLDDAAIALRSLDLSNDRQGARAVQRDLLSRVAALKRRESERADVLAASGGAETMLHGDLWPSNVLLVRADGSQPVRLIDWDEAAVGPIGFDLSTFLLRFDPSRRPAILGSYRNAVGRLAGWELPSDEDLNAIFETAADARIASLLVWSVAAADEEGPHSDWLVERLNAIVEWFDEVPPVLSV